MSTNLNCYSLSIFKYEVVDDDRRTLLSKTPGHSSAKALRCSRAVFPSKRLIPLCYLPHISGRYILIALWSVTAAVAL